MASIVFANLAPCIAVLLAGWTFADVIVFYWLETVIVVAFTYFKLRLLPRNWDEYEPGEEKMTQNDKVVPPIKKLSFFLLFYCVFCLGHGLMLFIFFGRFVAFSWTSITLATLVLVASHGVSLLTNYIGKGERYLVTTDQLMLHPWRRVSLMQLFLFVGGSILLVVPVLRMPVALAVFIAIKIGFDIRAYRNEHGARLRERIPMTEPPSPTG